MIIKCIHHRRYCVQLPRSLIALLHTIPKKSVLPQMTNLLIQRFSVDYNKLHLLISKQHFSLSCSNLTNYESVDCSEAFLTPESFFPLNLSWVEEALNTSVFCFLSGTHDTSSDVIQSVETGENFESFSSSSLSNISSQVDYCDNRRVHKPSRYRGPALQYLEALSNLSLKEQSFVWEAVVPQSSTIATHHCYSDINKQLLEFVLIPFIHCIEHIFSDFGVLLADIPLNVFFNHVKTVYSKSCPEFFFDINFIKSLKKSLYGDNLLPLLKHRFLPYPEHYKLKQKRQRLIELVSWKNDLQVVKELLEKTSTSSAGKTLSLMNRYLFQWIEDISTEIKHQRNTNATCHLHFMLSHKETGFIAIYSLLQALLREKQLQQSETIKSIEDNISHSADENLNNIINQHETNVALTKIYNDIMNSTRKNIKHLNASILNCNYLQQNLVDPIDTILPVTRLAYNIGYGIMFEIQQRYEIENKPESVDDTPWIGWSRETLIKVGLSLLDIIIRNTYIEVPRDIAINAIKQRLCLKKVIFNQKKLKLDNFEKLCDSPELSDFKSLQCTHDRITERLSNIQDTSFHLENFNDTIPIISFTEATQRQDSEFIVDEDISIENTTQNMNVWIRVFYHEILYQAKNKKLGVIRWPSFVKTMWYKHSAGSLLINYRIPYQPMVIPPLPWRVEINAGGYLYRQPQLIRQKMIGSKTLTESFNRSIKLKQLALIVSQIGSQPWKINQNVLNVVEKVWEHGRIIKGIPSTEYLQQPVFPQLNNIKTIDSQIILKHYQTDCHKVLQYNKKLSSDIPTFLLRLQTAQQFRQCDSIYFPHFLDFRGRAYPIPAHLNHQCGDLCRGLLLFGNGKPLGIDGLNWLKIHMAGLFGFDKLSFSNRIHWVNEHSDIIRYISIDPLSDRSFEFWSMADKPWQALSTAIELGSALQLSEPESFISYLPIHQDGSCNGLQHYAALGRDIEGGRAVNLLPSTQPEDVYTAVLKECLRQIESLLITHQQHPDFNKGKMILDHSILARKIVKTTVMTICYGVTQFGANEQLYKQLIEKYQHQFSDDTLKGLSQFIAKIIFSSVDSIFEKAMKLKLWLDSVSSICAKAKIPVCWIAPSGLPCIQPYFNEETVQIKTRLQSVTLHNDKKNKQEPNNRKQHAGLPPNYIHSLDASHMLMTAKKCFDNDLSFAAVHDSFWTHAADVTQMNRYIREEFIRLHSMPLLQTFYETLLRRGISNYFLKPPPDVGTLDISCVLDSPYFFTKCTFRRIKWQTQHGYWARRKKLIDFSRYHRYGYHECMGYGKKRPGPWVNVSPTWSPFRKRFW